MIMINKYKEEKHQRKRMYGNGLKFVRKEEIYLIDVFSLWF